MLERRLTEAADGVREALDDLVPPPVTDVVGTPRPDTPRQTGSSPVWRGPLIAVATAVAIIAVVGVSLLMIRGGDSLDIADEPIATTVLEQAVTTTTAAPTVDGSVPVVWDPILATTKATAAPPAATCPGGTDPEVPGPIDQVRPGEGPWNNQAAVFDTHAGQILYLDETGETWTFDVCTNTWHAMDPEGTPYGDWRVSREFGELVYDVDSDRTVAFGPRGVSVYDANTNTWTQRTPPADIDIGGGMPGLGAVYDPISGLVVLQTEKGSVVYDVDTDSWTPLGQLSCSPNMVYDADSQQWSPADPVPGCTPFLIGYDAETDRMLFLGFQSGGLAVDPRTGESTHLEAPDGGVMGGFGSFRYATGGETAYTYGERGVCRLDPATLSWDCSAGSQREAMPTAMVYDPINTRVVVINDFCCTWPGTTVSDDVWAIDFGTREQTELLATANTRTETDGS
jgi:hypothetical protein